MPTAEVFNKSDGAVYTTSQGAPVLEPYAAERIGLNGPLLLQDFNLIGNLTSPNSTKCLLKQVVPASTYRCRRVHAKGSGAHGVFEVTKDLSDLSCAHLFSEVGTQTPVTIRFSTVGGELGSADTVRDPRGFAIKFKTEEGNWDLIGNNTPVFFIRDAAKFPHFIHTQKRDPQTHLKDPDAFWDYLSQNPECIHQVVILFGDRGIPDGYRFQHGYSGYTFKLVKRDGDFVYTQIHVRSNQGFKHLTAEEALKLSGENPDYAQQDLFEAIERGDHPSWTLYVQTMTPKQAEEFKYNILDLTKIWPHKDFPLREVGQITLNKNPENYFAEVEQVAFSPSHLVPGIEPSADPVLQSRLFSYPDAHRYRIGPNSAQLPVNAPLYPVSNFQRDGPMAYHNQGFRPNYQSSIQPLKYVSKGYTALHHEQYVGAAVADLSFITELEFEQPRDLWRKVFDECAKERFINNLAGHLSGVKSEEVKVRTLAMFGAVSPDIGERLAKALGHSVVPPFQPAPASHATLFRGNFKKVH